MVISTEFLIYVALYRLSVLTVGALSIYFGFRLFARSDEDKLDLQSSSSEVKAWKIKMSFTNFWPGAFFTFFGTGLIAVMLWQGAPQVTLEDIKNATADRKADDKAKKGEALNASSSLEPCEPTQLSADAQKRLNREWEELKRPGLTLEDSSKHLSSIAHTWFEEGHIAEALVMARLSYMYGPEEDRVANLSLYTELLEANGEMQRAVKLHKELVELRKGNEVAAE